MKRIDFPDPPSHADRTVRPVPRRPRRDRRWRSGPLARAAAVSGLVVLALAVGIAVGRLSGRRAELQIAVAGVEVAGISLSRDGGILLRPAAGADPEKLLAGLLDLAFGVQAARAAREADFEPHHAGYCQGIYHAALEETEGEGWLLRVVPPAGCPAGGTLSAMLLQAWGIGVPAGEAAATALESVRLGEREELLLITMRPRSGDGTGLVRGELLDREGLRPLWEWDPARSCPYDLKRSQGAAFSGFFELIDLDGDEVREIVVSANHSPLYPSVLAVLEAATGRELAAFWNCGHLRLETILRDPEDGRGDLLLISGFANCAVLDTHHYPYPFMAGIRIDDFLRDGGGQGPVFARDTGAAQLLDAGCDALVPLLRTAGGTPGSGLTAAERRQAAEHYAQATAGGSARQILARRPPARVGGGYAWYAVFPPLEPAVARGFESGASRLTSERLEVGTSSGLRACLTPAGEGCGPLASSRLSAALHPIAEQVFEDFEPVVFRPVDVAAPAARSTKGPSTWPR